MRAVNFLDGRLPARFWDKVIPEPNSGCWLWIAGSNEHGYGQTSLRHRKIVAHKYAFEATVGVVPAGLELDHLCRTPCCVNPAHLEPVTHQVNLQRGVQGAITHCKNGHEYTEQNTLRDKEGRHCRACHRVNALARKARLRAERNQ